MGAGIGRLAGPIGHAVPVWRCMAGLLMGVGMTVEDISGAERQITHAAHGHVLTNINVWSPDSRWIVYDVRAVDSVFDGTRIEKVNVETGEVQR